MYIYSDFLYFTYAHQQVQYDPSGVGKRAKDKMILTLGWWHSYKVACYTIFKRYKDSFMAGCFHAMFPTNTFSPKPFYFTRVIHQLSTIRLAYPKFRVLLKETLELDNLHRDSKINLMNIKCLCEFLIPAVIYTIIHP
jgi:hypothetical protein